ncbi:MAG: nodulation protein NfeD [Bdellovibrionales bacterium]|nr:nodulation protein NfeD [Bdellovibrionales bacterium]
MKTLFFRLLSIVFLLLPGMLAAQPDVAVLEMDMMILPGTARYLQKSIERADQEGMELLIVKLDTPGGILQTSQEMVQSILNAPIPVVVYVSPAGGTATSAGVFITLASHVAVMAPSTSIGAAHPVAGDGKDIEGDMRAKAENITVAMVRSIAEERGRNVEWAEKAVKESASLTEIEAAEMHVVDFVASDVQDLLHKVGGKEVVIKGIAKKLPDFSEARIVPYTMDSQDRLINVFANPHVAAILWLGATTGISMELYNPGAILPGVVGVICLVLALLVGQIIPMSQGAVLLIALGALMIGAELYVTSGILGIGGLISMALGVLYLVDVQQAPGLSVSLEFVIPVVVCLAAFMLLMMRTVIQSIRRPMMTGTQGLIGQKATVVDALAPRGRVFVNGEYWTAEKATGVPGVLLEETEVEVVSVEEGMLLLVHPIKKIAEEKS